MFGGTTLVRFPPEAEHEFPEWLPIGHHPDAVPSPSARRDEEENVDENEDAEDEEIDWRIPLPPTAR